MIGRRSVLVASDLSEASDLALRTGASLAAASGGALHVVHVTTPPVFLYADAAGNEGARRRWVADARSRLEDGVGRVMGPGSSPASVEVRVGDVATEIGDRAEAVEAGVIVLGPHRTRAALDEILGTTVERLLRTARVPCLVANRALEGRIRRALIPVDFSGPSLRALSPGVEWLIEQACREPTGPTVIAEVVYVDAFAAPSYRVAAPEEKLTTQVEAIRDRIDRNTPLRILPRIASAPLPVDGILRAADESAADVIILGTRAFGVLGRTLIGSVGSAVARSGRYPILLVGRIDG